MRLSGRGASVLLFLTAASVAAQTAAVVFRHDGWPLTHYPMFTDLGRSDTLSGYELWGEDEKGGQRFIGHTFRVVDLEIYRIAFERGDTAMLKRFILERYLEAGPEDWEGEKIGKVWLVELRVPKDSDYLTVKPERRFIAFVNTNENL